MQPNRLAAALLGAVLLLPQLVAADVDLRQVVVEHRLDNGMKFMLVRRPSAPVFTAYVRVKAGGADEVPGKTGLAHLFEHLAFKGTPVIGSRDWERERPIHQQIALLGEELLQLQQQRPTDEKRIAELMQELADLSKAQRALSYEEAVMSLLARHGASDLNATTDKDMTSYFVSLPANRLELWALLEASRLAAPVPRDFYAERDVVMEERRLRVESDPMGKLFEELMTVAFSASPYRWPTVGYFADLESLTVNDAMRFHAEYYAPANAVGAIVGDIDIEETKRLLDWTFGAIPARPAPRRLPAQEPPQNSQRRSTVYFHAEPQLAMAFHKPTVPERDDYVFDVIQIVLAEGRTSRLWRSLVQQKQVAAQAFATMAPGARMDHLFVIGATPMNGRSFEEVEAAIWAELERLKQEPLSERELQMVQNKLEAHHAREISTNAGLASALTFFEVVAGDWRYMADHRKKIAELTPEDVLRVARKYFVPSNSTVVTLVRETPLTGAPGKEGGR